MFTRVHSNSYFANSASKQARRIAASGTSIVNGLEMSVVENVLSLIYPPPPPPRPLLPEWVLSLALSTAATLAVAAVIMWWLGGLRSADRDLDGAESQAGHVAELEAKLALLDAKLSTLEKDWNDALEAAKDAAARATAAAQDAQMAAQGAAAATARESRLKAERRAKSAADGGNEGGNQTVTVSAASAAAAAAAAGETKPAPPPLVASETPTWLREAQESLPKPLLRRFVTADEFTGELQTISPPPSPPASSESPRCHRRSSADATATGAVTAPWAQRWQRHLLATSTGQRTLSPPSSEEEGTMQPACPQMDAAVDVVDAVAASAASRHLVGEARRQAG